MKKLNPSLVYICLSLPHISSALKNDLILEEFNNSSHPSGIVKSKIPEILLFLRSASKENQLLALQIIKNWLKIGLLGSKEKKLLFTGLDTVLLKKSTQDNNIPDEQTNKLQLKLLHELYSILFNIPLQFELPIPYQIPASNPEILPLIFKFLMESQH